MSCIRQTRLSRFGTPLVVLSAGPISHNSIHFLIIITDFVALYSFTGYVVFIITSFLVRVEYGVQCSLNSEFLSCFSGFCPDFWGHNEYKVVFSVSNFVNFPFLSSNIPFGLSCDVYISQLIRYARCCSYYDEFGYHHKLLVDRHLSQCYEVKRLRNSFKKFYGRYPDLIRKYQRSVKDMMADSFPD